MSRVTVDNFITPILALIIGFLLGHQWHSIRLTPEEKAVIKENISKYINKHPIKYMPKKTPLTLEQEREQALRDNKDITPRMEK